MTRLPSWRRFLLPWSTRTQESRPVVPGDEVGLLREGWSAYARRWTVESARMQGNSSAQFLGDEWTAEDVRLTGGTAYGLDEETSRHFSQYLQAALVDRYLPSDSEGLEIGPGGGRLTELLIPRSRVLHLLDSAPMLEHVRRRFPGAPNLRFHVMDGFSLPALKPGSLEYVFSFDTFVHFEPRLVFWYLRQMVPLLSENGVAVIHYADILTQIGWRQFENDLADNVHRRTTFYAFGVMCRPIMRRFVDELGCGVIAEPDLIPRDAVVVFKKLSVG